MWRMDDGRTLVQALFSRKRPVDTYPYLHGRQRISYPARRNDGEGYLSALLAKAVVVALRGAVEEIAALADPPGVMVRSRSQSGRGTHTCYLAGEGVWLPWGRPTYHLGLLALGEALIRRREALDLLDGWEELLAYREGGDIAEDDPRFVELIAHAADEVYFWLRYEDHPPGPEHDRLERVDVRDARDPPRVAHDGTIDARTLTDLGRLHRHRREGASPARGVFRGWQLGELVETLDLGMNALLIGPTATGKSLCAFEAFERVRQRRPLFVIEGHESLREFDLLGGYTPDGAGGYVWHDGVLTQAMRAGGFLFVDEANRMPTRTLNVLLGALSRGAVVLTEHGSEEVEARGPFAVVMAMNLGHGYAVNQLDRALVNRFQVTLEFRYLPPDQERDLLVELTGIDPQIAETMVRVAGETRLRRRSRELSGELTPRGLVAWAEKAQARLLSDGRDLAGVLKATARVTWVHSVAGVDRDGYLRDEVADELMVLIESHTRRW